MRRHPWWSTGIGIIVLSAMIVFWAGTRPGFDPYGWLVWGHQTLHLNLDTNAAPSWKPLPYLFTVPYALAGHYEMRLWMITAVSVSLAGCVFAGRITYRLVDPPPERRWAGIVAAVFSGLALLGIQDYAHYVLSAQSDPMIVSLVPRRDRLPSVQAPAGRVRAGRAGFARPSRGVAVPGRLSLWMWLRVPRTRWLVAGGWVAIVLLWFGIPALTSRTPFVAAANALDSGRRLTSDQIFGTMGRFLGLNELPVELAALLAVVLAVLRRDLSPWRWRRGRRLGGGRDRVRAARLARARALHVRGRRGAGGARRGGRRPAAAGRAPLVGGARLGRSGARRRAGGVPGAGRRLARSGRAQGPARAAPGRPRSTTWPVIGHWAVPPALRCGEPLTRLEYQTMLAYTLKMNVNQVGFKYSQAIAHGNPIVLFTPYPTGVGWLVQAMHQTNPACWSLPH